MDQLCLQILAFTSQSPVLWLFSGCYVMFAMSEFDILFGTNLFN